MSLVPIKIKNKDLQLIGESDDPKKIYLSESEEFENTIKTTNAMPTFDMEKLKCLRMLISGSSGSGKTYMAEEVLHQLNPKIVYLFSSIEDDDYKDFNVRRIDLNYILNTNKDLNVHDIYEMIEPKTVAIFDDIVSFGTKLSKPYLELRLLMLQKGRHKQQSVLVVEQQANAGNQKGSREVLLNCNYFIMFPKNNFRSFTSISKQYLGIPNKKIEYLQTLKTRYIMISKNYPAYYVSSPEIGML